MKASDLLFFTFMVLTAGACLSMLTASVLINGGLI